MSYEDGWFKVSRRLFDSSRWHRGSGDAIKVLVFLVGKAQDPLNPSPGAVQMGETAIANCTGLTVEAATQALDWLCSPDNESRTRTEDGCTVRRRPDGSGYELVNYEPYHPGDRERAEARTEKARRAAQARWGRRGVGEGAAVSEGPSATPTQSGRDMQATAGREADPPTQAAAPSPTPRVRVTREATGESVPLEESFKPTVQYPTKADWDAACLESGRLCSWLEGRVGRSSGEVFRAAADYPGANGFKTRADGCSPARLEQTLLTLLEWKRRVERAPVMLPDQAFALKPKPGEASPKRDVLSIAADEIRARLEAERGDGPEADRASGWQAATGRAALPGE